MKYVWIIFSNLRYYLSIILTSVQLNTIVRLYTAMVLRRHEPWRVDLKTGFFHLTFLNPFGRNPFTETDLVPTKCTIFVILYLDTYLIILEHNQRSAESIQSWMHSKGMSQEVCKALFISVRSGSTYWILNIKYCWWHTVGF